MTSSFWMNANERMSLVVGDSPAPDRFAALLRNTGVGTPSAAEVIVKSGDTLVGIVQRQAASRGEPLSQSQAFAQAMALAKANGIDNPNLIHPGQRLSLAALYPSGPDQVADGTAPTARASTETSAQSNPAAPATQALLQQRQVASAGPRTVMRSADQSNTPILTRTLDRAVAKGFIPAQDRQPVYDKIIDMSKTYGFAPDDFARMTLMESDGMNPKATNNSCHGIIQFCDGPDRGAASAGFAANPRAILHRSVLQQLDLVAKYFDDTGLRKVNNVGLDDLYLTVLTPAARNESRAAARLNIPGVQSEYLYTNNDRRLPITRQSIVQGLHQNAQERLGMEPSAYLQLVNRVVAGANRPTTVSPKAPTPSTAQAPVPVQGQGVWLASTGGKALPPSLPGGQALPQP